VGPTSHLLHGGDHSLLNFESRSNSRNLCAGRTARFPYLLHDAQGARISRHVEAQNLAPVMADNKEAIQDAKSEPRDREEVHRRDGFSMIS